ncbi:MAG: hypothetical protein V4550_12670 [Gemmatimonadota bacterium]
MGAWGYGIMQNDTARDYEVYWNTYVARGRKKDPEFWTVAQVDDFVWHGRFRSEVDYGDPNVRAELLAAALLYRKAGLPLGGRVFDAVEKAASLELGPDELKEYASPAARKRAILKFMESFGMQQRSAADLPPGEARPSALRSEVEKWVAFSARYPEWIEVSHRPFSHKPFFDLVPQWFFALQDVLGKGAGHNDKELENQGKKYRLMCLAFYTGFVMRLPDDERLRLIEKVDRDWNEMYFLPMP